MASELMKYSTGEVMPSRVERGIAKQAKRIYDRTRLAGFEVDANTALAVHMMEKTIELDEHRRSLAGDDPGRNMMLLDIQLNTIRNMKRTQDRVNSGWNL